MRSKADQPVDTSSATKKYRRFRRYSKFEQKIGTNGVAELAMLKIVIKEASIVECTFPRKNILSPNTKRIV